MKGRRDIYSLVYGWASDYHKSTSRAARSNQGSEDGSLTHNV